MEGEDVTSDEEGDEEVFALRGMPADEDEDEEEDEGEEDEPLEDEDDDNLEELAAQVAKANAKSKKGKQKEDAASEEGSESEEEGWGRNKAAYYASNADELASDDEEANEMEEQEAKRLQLKARDVLADDEFGFVDSAESLAEPQA